MILHNATTGVIILSDIAGGESGSSLILQPNSSTTIFNQAAQQSAQLAQFITGGQITVTSLAEPSQGTSVDNLEAQAGGGLPLSGGTMTGAIAMGAHKITGLAAPTAAGDAARKADSDAALAAAAAAQATANLALPAAKLLTIDSAAGAGGAASATLTFTGLLTSDVILGASQKVAGANGTALTGFNTQASDALTVTWTADPGAGAIVRLAIHRA